MVPRTMACRYEMDLDETEVAQAFATSLAPLLYASIKAKKVPMAKTSVKLIKVSLVF